MDKRQETDGQETGEGWTRDRNRMDKRQESDGQETGEGWTRHRGGFRDYTKSAPMLLLEGCLLSLTPLSPNLQEASDGRGYCWPKR